MDEGEALEAKLRDDLDDWPTWLVYGDWLLEQGDPRGELIQLAHRRITRRAPEEEMRDALVELEKAHRPKLEGAHVITHKHGFATGVSVAWKEDASAFIAQLLASRDGRFITRLDIRGADPIHLARFDEIDLSHLRELGMSEASSLEPLASNATLANLRALHLHGVRLGDDAVRMVARGFFRGLRMLDVAYNQIGARGCEAIASAPWSLRALDLRNNPIGEEGARVLALAPSLASLESLDLYIHDIDKRGARWLTTSPHLCEGIRRLYSFS